MSASSAVGPSVVKSSTFSMFSFTRYTDARLCSRVCGDAVCNPQRQTPPSSIPVTKDERHEILKTSSERICCTTRRLWAAVTAVCTTSVLLFMVPLLCEISFLFIKSQHQHRGFLLLQTGSPEPLVYGGFEAFWPLGFCATAKLERYAFGYAS